MRRGVPHRVSPEDLDGPNWVDPRVARRFLVDRARPPSAAQLDEVLGRVRPVHHRWLRGAVERANRARRQADNQARYRQLSFDQPTSSDRTQS